MKILLSILYIYGDNHDINNEWTGGVDVDNAVKKCEPQTGGC